MTGRYWVDEGLLPMIGRSLAKLEGLPPPRPGAQTELLP